jgi:predicted negative regulator of RcsB-dependent stress response
LSSTEKDFRKSLKGPDAFQRTYFDTTEWMSKNIASVLGILGLVCLIGIGIVGFTWFTKSQSENRRHELSSILASREKETKSVQDSKNLIQTEIDLIRSKSSAAPDSKGPAGSSVPGAPSAADLAKITELESKMATAKPDHTVSSKSLRDFFDKNAKNPEGWVAGGFVAKNLIEEGKLAEAKDVLISVSKSSFSEKIHQIQSRSMLSQVLVELGEYDNAIKELDIVAGLVDDEMKPTVLFQKAQVYHFKQDPTSARPILDEILEKHKSSREASMARALLAMVGKGEAAK